MDKFTHHVGIAAPLPRADINTDDIIPARFLKSVRRTGFGKALFANWRYLGDDATQNPDFVLNKPALKGATILVSDENFGCGSSREHAPWALREFGFVTIIAPSFADIFYNNCFNSGILPVVLGGSEVHELLEALDSSPGISVEVDLPQQKIALGDRSYSFQIDAFRKRSLLEGLDTIGWIRSHEADVTAYEERRRHEAPWLFPVDV